MLPVHLHTNSNVLGKGEVHPKQMVLINSNQIGLIFYCAPKSWPESWPTLSAAHRNN